MVDRTKRSTRFFKLYTGVQPRIYSFLLTLVHNPLDAEELLQETASVLWEQFDKYQEGTNFGAWAIAIAKLKAFECLRQNKKRRLLLEDKAYRNIAAVAESVAAEPTDHMEALRKCLNKIDESCRSLLAMRYKKNLHIKEISKITHKTPNTLYKTLRRILESLRKCIERNVNREEIA